MKLLSTTTRVKLFSVSLIAVFVGVFSTTTKLFQPNSVCINRAYADVASGGASCTYGGCTESTNYGGISSCSSACYCYNIPC